MSSLTTAQEKALREWEELKKCNLCQIKLNVKALALLERLQQQGVPLDDSRLGEIWQEIKKAQNALNP